MSFIRALEGEGLAGEAFVAVNQLHMQATFPRLFGNGLQQRLRLYVQKKDWKQALSCAEEALELRVQAPATSTHAYPVHTCCALTKDFLES